MSSVTELDPTDEDMARTLASSQRPTPLSSVTAAAKRITGKSIKKTGTTTGGKSESWQEDAWDMYDLVGEERFLASTLANRMGQARFFVGKIPQDTTEDVEQVTDGPAYDAFETIVGKGKHFEQMVTRMGINLFIPGDGYFVGIPEEPPEKETGREFINPFGEEEDDEDLINVEDLTWQMLSVSEIEIDENSGTATIKVGGKKREVPVDDIVLIRVWRAHPRWWWKADSPTRSSLPVLRELVGLTMHISAQVDSRLAGAGVLLVPASADAALRAAAGLAETDKESPFTDALIEAMIEPIADRSNASAVVPLTVTVPDESIEKFKHMTFSSQLDAEARNLREEAIRRLALGQDCPPELLLGVAGMNHWGAWLVREDVVTTHLEPPLALICDAFTTQFLWPVLEQQGISDFQDYVIWYDVDHLIMRPNRAADAAVAHEAGVISDNTYRDALGFDESDAPEADPNDPINTLILDMIREAPTLVQNPGLAVLAEQIRALVNGGEIPESPQEEEVPPEEEAPAPSSETEETPAEEGPPPEQPAIVASGLKGVRCGLTYDHHPHDTYLGHCEGRGKGLKR